MNIVITGGAGFIGSNAAARCLKRGDKVTIFDNLSRIGSQKNIDWLKTHDGQLEIVNGDIRARSDLRQINRQLKAADLVLHLAGQVAVTTSVASPLNDFESNALGTLLLLELMRQAKSQAKLIYASTNKVYGGMETIGVVEDKTHYRYEDLLFGVSEAQPLDFHSPYGCSKGAADQYVHDYQRIYGLDTVVFRQSCIYGPRQFGVEDQGWVAWFMIAVLSNKQLTIYGDGKQVRDLLYIEDLLDAYDAAFVAGKKSAGQIYNIGGGVNNSLSIWCEFGPLLEKVFGRKISVIHKDWRPGDQKIYISDIRKAKKELKWLPKIRVNDGISLLYSWVNSNKQLFDDL